MGAVNQNSRSYDEMLDRNRPAIHLEFEAAHGRPAVVPREPLLRRATGDDLVRQKWVKIMHGIGLAGAGILPSETQQPQPPLHFAQHEDRLLAHGARTGLAVAYRALAIERTAFAGLAAAGHHEACCRRRRWQRKSKGVEARFARRRNFWTDVAARHRIAALLAVVNPPLFQGANVGLVEGAKASVRKRGGRAQLASAERAQRPSAAGYDCGDACETAGQRYRRGKAHALDLEARLSRDPSRILKDPRDEAIATRRKHLGHASASIS